MDEREAKKAAAREWILRANRESASPPTAPLTVVVVVDERIAKGLRKVGRDGDISDGAAAVLAQWIQDWENSAPELFVTAETTKQ